jgi:glutathione S-transferase
MLTTLRTGLQTEPWILGERFSAADVMLGAGVHFLRMFKLLGDEPALIAYAERCLARPAAQRALAADA